MTGKQRVWYNWPAGYYKSKWHWLLPLHQMVRRFVTTPFLLLSFGLFYLFVYIGWGREDAKEVFERVW